MPILNLSRSTRLGVLSLAVVLLAGAVWAGVAASQSPGSSVLAAAPDESLAGHGITLEAADDGSAPKLDLVSARAAANKDLTASAVRESRLVHFRQQRDPDLGPQIDTLAWALVLDVPAPILGGPMPDGARTGVACRRVGWAPTTDNTYFVIFIDANNGEVLANVSGSIGPVPTPVCTKP